MTVLNVLIVSTTNIYVVCLFSLFLQSNGYSLNSSAPPRRRPVEISSEQRCSSGVYFENAAGSCKPQIKKLFLDYLTLSIGLLYALGSWLS